MIDGNPTRLVKMLPILILTCVFLPTVGGLGKAQAGQASPKVLRPATPEEAEAMRLHVEKKQKELADWKKEVERRSREPEWLTISKNLVALEIAGMLDPVGLSIDEATKGNPDEQVQLRAKWIKRVASLLSVADSADDVIRGVVEFAEANLTSKAKRELIAFVQDSSHISVAHKETDNNNMTTGGTIIFDHFQDRKWGFGVMNADGSNKQIYMHDVGDYFDPVQNPNSEDIVFYFVHPGQVGMKTDADIRVLHPTSGKITNLVANSAYTTNPAWSPDGKQITFDCDTTIERPSGRRGTVHNIWIMNADGTRQRNLTEGENDTAGESDRDHAWSSDGSRIAFVSNRASRKIDKTIGDIFDVYTMDPNGQNMVRLTHSKTTARYPRWNPQGDHLLYLSGKKRRTVNVVELNGNKSRELTTCVLSMGIPAWNPAGDRIAFVRYTDTYAVYIVGLEGGVPKRLTRFPAHTAAKPTIGCSHPCWSPDGKWIVFGHDRTDSSVRNDDIYKIEIGSGRITQLTNTTEFGHDPTWYSSNK